MWSSLDKEISSIKEQVNNTKNASGLKDIMSACQNILFPNGPGRLIDIHQQTKSIYPVSFAGINLSMNKNITEPMKYNFNLNLDPTEFECYTPYNSYIAREIKTYSNKRNQAGFSSISFEHDISKELKVSVNGYIQHVNNGTVECVLDYFGKKYTSSISLVNTDISKTEVIAQHIHEINRKLAVGAELALQFANGSTIDSKKIALVGRYYDSNLDAILSSTLSLQGMQMCAYKRINSNLKLGSILDVCFQNKDITGSVACELADKEFTLRASIDSKGYLVGNLLKNNFYKNEGITFKPTISILCNLQKQIKVGIGFDLVL